MKVRTDHKWKSLKYGYELPKNQRKQFNYLSDEEFDTHNFVKYRRSYYDVNEFMAIPNRSSSDLGAWDGYHGETYFSGIVIKLSSDGERYKIGEAYV